MLQEQWVQDIAVVEVAVLHNRQRKCFGDVQIGLEQSSRGCRNQSWAPEERGVLTPRTTAEVEAGRHTVASEIGREAVLGIAAVVVRCRAMWEIR